MRLDAVSQLAPPELQAFAAEHPPSARALDVLRVEADLMEAGSLYHEPLRPQFHFTARRGWINDPHGPIYYEGKYHLFHQYQSFTEAKTLNNDKCWGHATSTDLVHWEQQPIALYPDAMGDRWSGSAVVDWNNSARLQTGTKPALLLFYTSGAGRTSLNPNPKRSADFDQRLAFSNDDGKTWQQFSGNPVMRNVTPFNRDPVVFWHAPSHRWVMLLYVGYPVSQPGNAPTAQIFTSDNLKDWTYRSRIEGLFDY